MILVDTNVLSELMRPEPDVRVVRWMDGLQKSEVGLSAISVAEILYGIGSLTEGRKKHRLLEAATRMFDEDFLGRIQAFDQRAAVEYADIVIRRNRLGAPISMADAQIAAICRACGADLATHNTKDFENTDVVLINPWKA